MSVKKRITVLTLIMVICIPTMVTPVAADDGEDLNLVCESEENTTDLGDLVANITELIVYMGAIIAIVLGAGYTMAAAANPSGGEDYTKNRNKAVKYGGGSVVALYLAEAVVSSIDDNLSFGCILPFA